MTALRGITHEGRSSGEGGTAYPQDRSPLVVQISPIRLAFPAGTPFDPAGSPHRRLTLVGPDADAFPWSRDRLSPGRCDPGHSAILLRRTVARRIADRMPRGATRRQALRTGDARPALAAGAVPCVAARGDSHQTSCAAGQVRMDPSDPLYRGVTGGTDPGSGPATSWSPDKDRGAGRTRMVCVPRTVAGPPSRRGSRLAGHDSFSPDDPGTRGRSCLAKVRFFVGHER